MLRIKSNKIILLWKIQSTVQKPTTMVEAAVSVFTLTKYYLSIKSVESRLSQPNY